MNSPYRTIKEITPPLLIFKFTHPVASTNPWATGVFFDVNKLVHASTVRLRVQWKQTIVDVSCVYYVVVVVVVVVVAVCSFSFSVRL